MWRNLTKEHGNCLKKQTGLSDNHHNSNINHFNAFAEYHKPQIIAGNAKHHE